MTTKEALEPTLEDLAIQAAGYLEALNLVESRHLAFALRARVESSRVSAPIVAPPNHALAQLLEAALLHPESAERNIRQVIESLSAPASTVAPQRSGHAFIPPAGAMCVRCGLSILAHQTAPASPAAPASSDAWAVWFKRLGGKASVDVVNATADLVTNERLAALVQAKVLPGPAALRDEAGPRSCVKCGHFDETDPRGKCMSVSYDAGGSLVYCGCKCESSTTPALPCRCGSTPEIKWQLPDDHCPEGFWEARCASTSCPRGIKYYGLTRVEAVEYWNSQQIDVEPYPFGRWSNNETNNTERR